MGSKVVFSTALTEVRINPTSYAEPLGTIREELNATYKYVAFSGTTTVAAGDAVCYLAYASDGNAQIVDGANTAFGAGIAMAAIASGTKAASAVAYATGWIQIEGIAVVSTTMSGSPTIGQTLTTSGAAAPALALVTAATQEQCAICYDVTAKKVMCQFPR